MKTKLSYSSYIYNAEKNTPGRSGPRSGDGGQVDIPKESNPKEDCFRETVKKIVICDRHWSQGTVSLQ